MDLLGTGNDAMELLGNKRATGLIAIVIVAVIFSGVISGRAKGYTAAEIESFSTDALESGMKLRFAALKLALNYERSSSPLRHIGFLSADATDAVYTPGSCKTYPPVGQSWEKEAEFRMIVNIYSIFGITARQYTVTCAGLAISG